MRFSISIAFFITAMATASSAWVEYPTLAAIVDIDAPSIAIVRTLRLKTYEAIGRSAVKCKKLHSKNDFWHKNVHLGDRFSVRILM